MERSPHFPLRLVHDSLHFHIRTWRGLSFWAIPDLNHASEYLRFEIYSIAMGWTYKLGVDNPFARTHRSGWNLAIIEFGSKKPSVIVSNHALLKTADFEELFAAMGVIADEGGNCSLLSDSNPEEIQKTCAKWKNWAKDLPAWILPTVEGTKRRQRR